MLPTDAETRSNVRTHHLNVDTFSGIHFLKCLRFNRHLRSANDLEEALDDGLDLAVPDTTVLGERPPNPSFSQIRRGRLQLDATSNHIRRRYMTDLAVSHPSTVRSAHLFSDASPATGEEL